MMKRLLLCALLAGSLAGCRIFEPKPTPNTCPEPAPAPQPPPVTTWTPGGILPKGATQIVGVLCPETGAFAAAGVDVSDRAFTYVVKGDRVAREGFLSSAYKAGVPVVLYTAPVKLLKGAAAGTSAVVTSGATAGGTTTADPCQIANSIGDPPPTDPKDKGNSAPKPIDDLTQLAWATASAVDGVSDPVASSSTQPAPGTTVPR
ncbi:hypothetical protein JY651_48540 [Pyxidicoccus parkwayensis]|uniref:Lipoprotein n=1 Tax=Pyxidicoccus parkwayensis TaxID=2813578 RepID=A0ABX7NZM4_9BACT|nr:hypothetical protein [Pyxidicoccus parkwaysis]QSQ22864.1 hypothetical protein JY651_48540 [Pyxidicoccus parkwaysis]